MPFADVLGHDQVKELLAKFAQMRQMMVQLGASTGLLGKIPGFKQFAQMKKLASMDIGSVFGGEGGGGPAPQLPSMPGMMPQVAPPQVPGLPKGAYTMPGTRSAAAPAPSRSSDRAKDKRKRKEARKQRKKARKKK